MGILKEEVIGNRIINEIESSNITKTEYNLDEKTLIVDFKNGAKYKYENVPHQIYTRFRMSESQGKFFSKEISKNYKYEKL